MLQLYSLKILLRLMINKSLECFSEVEQQFTAGNWAVIICNFDYWKLFKYNLKFNFKYSRVNSLTVPMLSNIIPQCYLYKVYVDWIIVFLTCCEKRMMKEWF